VRGIFVRLGIFQTFLCCHAVRVLQCCRHFFAFALTFAAEWRHHFQASFTVDTATARPQTTRATKEHFEKRHRVRNEDIGVGDRLQSSVVQASRGHLHSIIIPRTICVILSSRPQGHWESLLGSSDERRTAPSGRQPSDQATWLGLYKCASWMLSSTTTIAI